MILAHRRALTPWALFFIAGQSCASTAREDSAASKVQQGKESAGSAKRARAGSQCSCIEHRVKQLQPKLKDKGDGARSREHCRKPS